MIPVNEFSGRRKHACITVKVVLSGKRLVIWVSWYPRLIWRRYQGLECQD